MQKFIHDNEQYVLEVKKKHGKTKIDKELNIFLAKKNRMGGGLNGVMPNMNIMNNANNSFIPYYMNLYMLMQQQQMVLQQNNMNMQMTSDIKTVKDNEVENEDKNKKEKEGQLKQSAVEKEENDENSENQNQKNENVKSEIIKKLLEALKEQNNKNNDDEEDRQTDPRKKFKQPINENDNN